MRCQLDKNDLRKSLAQSQEASRREAEGVSDRIDKLTAERDRYKKLVNKSESSLNTASSTIDGPFAIGVLSCKRTSPGTLTI